MNENIQKLLQSKELNDINIENVVTLDDEKISSMLIINQSKIALLVSDKNRIILEESNIYDQNIWQTLTNCITDMEETEYDLDTFIFELIDLYYMSKEYEEFIQYLDKESQNTTFFRLVDKEYDLSSCQAMKGNFSNFNIIEAFMLILIDNKIEEIFIFDTKIHDFKLYDLILLNDKLENSQTNTSSLEDNKKGKKYETC